jgi:hypothetical protein
LTHSMVGSSSMAKTLVSRWWTATVCSWPDGNRYRSTSRRRCSSQRLRVCSDGPVGRRRDCGRPAGVMPQVTTGRAQGRTGWTQLLGPGCSLRRRWWNQICNCDGGHAGGRIGFLPCGLHCDRAHHEDHARGARFKVGTCCRVWTDGLSAGYGVSALPLGITAHRQWLHTVNDKLDIESHGGPGGATYL